MITSSGGDPRIMIDLEGKSGELKDEKQRKGIPGRGHGMGKGGEV